MSNFWADQIAEKAEQLDGRHVVSDAKTPSGRIHVGSLRGVVIHDLIFKAVKDSGQKVEYVYRFDDFDPMDGFPPELPDSFRKHMGEPLCNVPSPEKGYDSLAQYYAFDFREVFEKLDCKPRIVCASESYRAGEMNQLIRTALEKAEKIREINVCISGAKKQEGWLPINVVCEKCGKIGTTKVSGFDGETVLYECVDVKYAKGCGHSARISPFDGNAKLTWKADWAATWVLHNVTIEGAGKDHYAAGGSRDVANHLADEVFGYKHPYNFRYEFFIMGGKKMSTSKGIGVSARQMSESMPPELLRFLMARYKPQTAIDFNPDGDTIPKLYDDWDRFARIYFSHETARDPDIPRIFALSQVGSAPKDFFRPPFSFVAFLRQLPNVKVVDAIADYKGSKLSKEEKDELAKRIEYAKIWLEKFAPEEAKVQLVEKPDYSVLSEGQKKALRDFAEVFGNEKDDNRQMEAVKGICSKNSLTVGEFFEAAYTVFIGRKKGPKLLPFLKALDRKKVVARLSNA